MLPARTCPKLQLLRSSRDPALVSPRLLLAGRRPLVANASTAIHRPISTVSSFTGLSSSSLFSHARRPIALLTVSRRTFHPTPARQDVLFLSFPALKSFLLTVTRVTLLALPFVWRWRLWERYRRTSLALVQIPIFALCLVFALGLDQSPYTQRWRLLLMSEAEEMTWSRRRADDQLATDLPLLLPPSSPRSAQVRRVITRLLSALDEMNDRSSSIVSFAGSGLTSTSDGGYAERIAAALKDATDRETAVLRMGESAWMLEGKGWDGHAASQKNKLNNKSGRKLSEVEEANVISIDGWKLYVVDLPKVNAFALPSREIFVFSGLIDTCEDDTLLSAVLAHELAHVTQRHAVENMGFLNIATVMFDVIRGISYAFTLSFPLVSDSAAMFINWINDTVAHRAYSRKLEMEADEVGLQFMAQAGYDPRAAHDLWDLFAAVEADAAAAKKLGKASPASLSDRFEFLRTHPSGGDRQQNIRKHLPAALTIWKEALERERKRKGSSSSSRFAAATGVAPEKELAPAARATVDEVRAEGRGGSLVAVAA